MRILFSSIAFALLPSTPAAWDNGHGLEISRNEGDKNPPALKAVGRGNDGNIKLDVSSIKSRITGQLTTIEVQVEPFGKSKRFDRQQGGANGSWLGSADDGCSMNFITRDRGIGKKMSGSIVCPNENMVYQIQPDATGEEIIVATKSRDFPDEADPEPVDADEMDRLLLQTDGHKRGISNVNYLRKATLSPRRLNDRRLADDLGGNLDVMVLWTKNAECRNSGLPRGCNHTSTTTQNMFDRIDLAIAETNTAYDLSGVNTTLRLVRAYYEPTYDETASNAFNNALYALRGTTDGNMDDVHDKRTQYGADLVAMIIDDSQYCGIAYLGPSISYAFSVTAWNCATGYYTFGHEIGHNLGCNHDKGTSNACTNSNYNYGFRDPSGRFRSILAYNCVSGQCDSNAGGGCTRVQRFSNNEFFYNGSPIGTPDADNARHINDVRATVASWYNVTNTPTTGSCMSGDTGVIKQAGSGQKIVEMVKDLRVGDQINGLNEDQEVVDCTVEAIGTFGVGELYGNYTRDHFVLATTKNSDFVHEHGDAGLNPSIGVKYELMTSCPAGLDESGTAFTPIDSDFCGTGTRTIPWTDYVLLHASILRVVRQSGGFWFSRSSYTSMDVVAQYAPAVCEKMLMCIQKPNTCNAFEAACRIFVDKALTGSAKQATEKAFQKLGKWSERGSVSDIVTQGESVEEKR